MSDTGLAHLLLTVLTQMLHVVAPLYAEGYTTYRIAPEEAACDAHAPLITRALILQAGALLPLVFTMRTLEEHRAPFAKESRNSYEFSLLLCKKEL